MSVPTLQGLQTALSGLLAEQQAMDVTAANIANANTEGYSRETAVLQATAPIEIPALSAITGEGGRLPTGVTVDQITRIRNAQMQQISTQATEQVESRSGASGEVQSYATQAAQLNGQIRLAEEAGQQPNEMLDRRDLLLDKLSALAQTSVTRQPDATDTVSFGDAAQPLVEGTTVNWPQAITSASGGQLGMLLGLTGPGGQLSSYRE